MRIQKEIENVERVKNRIATMPLTMEEAIEFHKQVVERIEKERKEINKELGLDDDIEEKGFTGASKEPRKVSTPGLKKMKLSESLFKPLNEDFEGSFYGEEDGWGDEIQDATYGVFKSLERLMYEIRTSVRGSFTGCKTVEELANYIRSQAERLEEVADNIEWYSEDDFHIDESLNEDKREKGNEKYQALEDELDEPEDENDLYFFVQNELSNVGRQKYWKIKAKEVPKHMRYSDDYASGDVYVDINDKICVERPNVEDLDFAERVAKLYNCPYDIQEGDEKSVIKITIPMNESLLNEDSVEYDEYQQDVRDANQAASMQKMIDDEEAEKKEMEEKKKAEEEEKIKAEVEKYKKYAKEISEKERKEAEKEAQLQKAYKEKDWVAAEREAKANNRELEIGDEYSEEEKQYIRNALANRTETDDAQYDREQAKKAEEEREKAEEEAKEKAEQAAKERQEKVLKGIEKVGNLPTELANAAKKGLANSGIKIGF